ncbi:MAG: hypothetical protein AVDCRST_MAG64-2665, partial [uncultured Phycisphaerae bacterium]
QGAAPHVRQGEPGAVRPAGGRVDPAGDGADEQPVREQAGAGRGRQPGRPTREVGQAEHGGCRRAVHGDALPPAAARGARAGGVVARRRPAAGGRGPAVEPAQQAGLRLQLL